MVWPDGGGSSLARLVGHSVAAVRTKTGGEEELERCSGRCRLLTATTWSGDVEGVVSFGYDNNFWRVSEVVSGASGSQAATFGYDADGLVVCVSPTTCPGSGALSFARHSGNGMVTSATSGLLTETHSVSAYGEPARHVVADGTTTLYDLTLDSTLFPRDPLGRIVRKTEVVLGTTRASDYTYDVLGRLTDVVVNGATSEHYEYDPNGNRLRGVVTRDGVTTDWTGTYDAQDRLLSYGPLSFTYTANGELLTKTNADTAEVTDYTYDAFGNLRSVELPDGRLVEYLVDGQNRRVAKRIDGLTTKQWLWSSQLRIAGELNASGTPTKRFIYGEKVNVPELMVDVASGAVYRIVTDQLGSPVLVVNVADTSDVLLRAEYDAFGNRTVLSGDGDAVPFGFAGGLYDEDTGLVRFGARDYEPVVGRWVTKDPIRWEGGQGNFYGYVGNDPVNRWDPRGMDWFEWLLEWEDLHRTRNKHNRCPPHPPLPVCSEDDSRDWEQDPDSPLPIPGMEGKWRGSDGSECRYDDTGNLLPDEGSFNFCPEPGSLCHVFADVLPHHIFGPGLGGSTQYADQ
jgi:RHS repeat-associated protein